MKPAVSVLLPVFNGAGTVARAVASIRWQTRPDWELIAVDDGSTDETAAVLHHLARGDSRIRLLPRRHEGITAALNAGLAEAASPLVARMDADDVAHPERLAEQVAFLARDPAVGLVGSLVEFGGDAAAAKGYALHVDWINSLISPEQIALRRFVESPFAHPSVTFRRELATELGSYRDGQFPEDYELWLRWLGAGVRMAKVPKFLLTWHDSAERLSRWDSRYASSAFFRCKAAYLAGWIRQQLEPGRPIYAWGAGRLTRRRIEYLTAEGIALGAYIDIDARKVGRTIEGLPVLSPDQVRSASGCFVLCYVSKRGARELASAHLSGRGFVEGRDFLLVA